MNWILSAALCGILVEIAVRLPFSDVVARLSRSGRRAVSVLRAKAVSDHWKEKAMGAYARTTFLSTIRLAGLLLALAAVAAALVYGFGKLSGDFDLFILSWEGVAFSVLFACVYLAIRKYVVHVRL